MAYTGGGNPLPNQLRCSWCDYSTPKRKLHMLALAEVERHAQQQHPSQYAAAMAQRSVSPAHGPASAGG